MLLSNTPGSLGYQETSSTALLSRPPPRADLLPLLSVHFNQFFCWSKKFHPSYSRPSDKRVRQNQKSSYSLCSGRDCPPDHCECLLQWDWDFVPADPRRPLPCPACRCRIGLRRNQ